MGRKPKPRTEGALTALGKQEILDIWESLSPGALKCEPLAVGHEGTSYLSDTIRLTGSREWIESVLGNLRGLLDFDGDSSRLELTYKQTVDKVTDELTDAWAFYAKARARSGRSPGRPPGSKNGKHAPVASSAPESVQEVKKYHKPAAKAPSVVKEVSRAVATVEPPSKAPGAAKTAPRAARYAIGTRDGGEWIWTEPQDDGDGYPCYTYLDIEACNDAINFLKKSHAFTKGESPEIAELMLAGGKLKVSAAV